MNRIIAAVCCGLIASPALAQPIAGSAVPAHGKTFPTDGAASGAQCGLRPYWLAMISKSRPSRGACDASSMARSHWPAETGEAPDRASRSQTRAMAALNRRCSS